VLPCFLTSFRLVYNLPMFLPSGRLFLMLRLFCAASSFLLLFPGTYAQHVSPASSARTLLLPRTIVSGERATLAVLDGSGRLTPGVTVNFSNGDQLKTDATGRALFVAPLNPGVILASISGRPGKVPSTVLSPAEAEATISLQVTSVPAIASLSDRFEVAGRGFCGDADANQVVISGAKALVLASSPTSLVVLPPSDLVPGRASLAISCAKRNSPPFDIVFVTLDLQADSSPLVPGQHRSLTVRVRGTNTKVELEAKNQAPDIAELTGGNPAKTSSSGGTKNLAHFEVVGRKRGNFAISIRLLPSNTHPP
jgi:hypothetical protein